MVLFTSYILSYDNLVPVRECLARVAQDWDGLDLPGICPFSFTEEELKKHNKGAEEYEVISKPWDMVQTVLYTNWDGWVRKGRWGATTELNNEVYDKFVESVGRGESLDEAAKMYEKYPFPPKIIVELRD